MRWIELRPHEFRLVWTSLGLGEPPLALELAHIGRTPDELAAWIASASAAMRERGLGAVDRPAAKLAQMLRGFAAGRQQLEMDVATSHTRFTAVGADAVIITRAGDVVRVEQTGRMTTALFAAVPELPKGGGVSANVSIADFAVACEAGEAGGPGAFLDALCAAGVRDDDAEVITTAIAHRVGGGRLANQRAANEEPLALSWVDTARGRFAVTHRAGWLTVTPADRPRLVAMAEDMLAATAPS